MKPRYVRLLGDINPCLRDVIFLVTTWHSEGFQLCFFNETWTYRYDEQAGDDADIQAKISATNP